jgi:3-oxoacyl-[acyl-carrier protein] reductase
MKNIIFITGASSDVGIAFIKSIKEKCIIVAHYNTNNSSLLKLQKNSKNMIFPIKADFSSENSIIGMLDKIETEIGIPNKILHLASQRTKNIRFKDDNWRDLQSQLNISLGSITIILNRFLPKMAINKNGKIVCMLSSYTIGVPPKAMSQYVTVKYALLGLMRSLASEYATKKVTINCISPSMINTQFLSDINERVIELTAESHPLKRIAEVSDLIPSIMLLLSDDSNYINGINLPISGGLNF